AVEHAHPRIALAETHERFAIRLARRDLAHRRLAGDRLRRRERRFSCAPPWAPDREGWQMMQASLQRPDHALGHVGRPRLGGPAFLAFDLVVEALALGRARH